MIKDLDNRFYVKFMQLEIGLLLDFSVSELVRSQSTFSTDSGVLQNRAGFTLCSSAGLAVRECSAVMGLTLCMLCVQIH